MKILIAVPTFENIYPDTFRSIYNLDGGGHELVFEFVRGYDCATARNNIAQKSMDIGADYVLMVDNDVVLPKDVLLMMLEDAKDVCLGYYAHRCRDNVYNGKTSVCKVGEFNYTMQYTAEELGRLRESGTHKLWIHGGGMGCALIRVDVFRRIQYPWYDWVNYNDNSRGMLSEDLFFCEQCRKAGILIFTDTRAACGHMLRHVQWPVWQKGDAMYRVMVMFDDMQDRVPTANGESMWRYYPGDEYPRKGAEPSPERIAELLGSSNARKTPLITEICDDTEEPEEEKAEEQAEEAEPEPEEAPKPKRRRTVKEK